MTSLERISRLPLAEPARLGHHVSALTSNVVVNGDRGFAMEYWLNQSSLPNTSSILSSKFYSEGAQRWHYLELGDHEVARKQVVIIASPLIVGRTYLPLAEKLSRDYLVKVIELLGSGDSSQLLRPISFEEHARHLELLFERLQLSGSIVVGHSNSGAPVIELAASRPDLVGGVVLADTIGIPPHNKSLMKTFANRAFDSLLEPKVTVSGSLHLLKNAIVHTRNFFEQIRVSVKTDLVTRIAEVRAPVLIAWGKRDHTLPKSCAQVFASLLRQSFLYFSKQGSHDWLIERPGEFSSLLTTWEKSLVSSKN